MADDEKESTTNRVATNEEVKQESEVINITQQTDYDDESPSQIEETTAVDLLAASYDKVILENEMVESNDQNNSFFDQV